MSGNWYDQGFQKVKEVGKRLEELQNRVYLPVFTLSPGEEATVSFITDEPFTFYEHFVKSLKQSFTCSQALDCPICCLGHKPTFRGAFLIIDHRLEMWKDKQTGEEKSRQNTLKILKFGIRALQVLERKNERKGLKNYSWIITRTGAGNDTQYDFEDIQKVEFVMPQELPDLREILAPKDSAYIRSQLALAGAGIPQQPIVLDKDEDTRGVIDFSKI